MDKWQKDYWRAVTRLKKAYNNGKGARLTHDELHAFLLAGLFDEDGKEVSQ